MQSDRGIELFPFPHRYPTKKYPFRKNKISRSRILPWTCIQIAEPANRRIP
ncbi:hypothetical protein MOMMJLID_CDS0021 [Arthrobacter phage 1191A]|nr:hypothetical protein MOMMJLID_CDS0021 [Arthrobacter phage 1191A]